MSEGDSDGGQIVEEAGFEVVVGLILPPLHRTHLEEGVKVRGRVNHLDGRRVEVPARPEGVSYR